MVQYDAGEFSDIFDTALGKDMWSLVSSPDSQKLLITHTKLGKPAIEAILIPLEKLFLMHMSGTENIERFKKMSLDMVWQVMLQQGYCHVACAFMPKGSFLKRAAVFRKKG